MLTAIADQLEKSQRDYDNVAATFTALLSEIAETLEGDQRKDAFRAANDALGKGSANSQLEALHAVRASIRQ